ncbi:hypothetical protein PR202_ga17042 [Eleusine coracana subsp. coracana]|uniref:BTB domain-containing protein n=1 Tax=Eleusine coracana subsp. coracana TaxID=191504 RepID=A0AAV5CPE4_ELECO|nr:hypothetical protein PR202_ga17042 [Eleusine coracana subsp. coracana]
MILGTYDVASSNWSLRYYPNGFNYEAEANGYISIFLFETVETAPLARRYNLRSIINDMEPEVFKTLLHFMYTDTLPKTDEGALSATMAEGQIAAADTFKLAGLKKICEEMLCRRVDLSTVETSLVLADQHRCRALKAKCMEFLNSPENLKAVMANSGFEIVKKNCPTVLFDLVMKQMV